MRYARVFGRGVVVSYRDLVGQCPLGAPRAQVAARRRQCPTPAPPAPFTELTLLRRPRMRERPRPAACEITLVAKFCPVRDVAVPRTLHTQRGEQIRMTLVAGDGWSRRRADSTRWGARAPLSRRCARVPRRPRAPPQIS